MEVSYVCHAQPAMNAHIIHQLFVLLAQSALLGSSTVLYALKVTLRAPKLQWLIGQTFNADCCINLCDCLCYFVNYVGTLITALVP